MNTVQKTYSILTEGIRMENKEMFLYDIENFRVLITKCDTTAAGEIAVASEYNGYPVVFVNPFAFKGCDKLTKITIPASIMALDSDTFADCPNLSEIVVDENNPKYHSEDGVLFDTRHNLLLRYPEGHSGTTYAVPDLVDKIHFRAFSGARQLRRVTVHDKVDFIGMGSFFDCAALEEIIIDKENPVFASVDGAWLNKEKTALYWVPQGEAQTGYCVPECVEKIKHAFIGHGTLRSVAIPVTVNFIGAYSFEDCDALTDVYYAGTPEQWQAIDIEDGNECLQKATIHYNCHPDGEPKETLKPMIE